MSCRSFSPSKSIFTLESKSNPIQSAGNLEEYPYVRIHSQDGQEYRITILSIDSKWREYPGKVKIRLGDRLQVKIGNTNFIDDQWESSIPEKIWLTISNGKIRMGFGEEMITSNQIFVLDVPVDWENPAVFPYLSRISIQEGILERIDFCLLQNSTPIPAGKPLNKKAGWIFLALFLFILIVMVTRR